MPKLYLRMKQLLLAAVFLPVLASCSDGDAAYKIGVSQCAGGIWREKVNSEMLAAQHLYRRDVEVSIADAHDDVALQVHQIDSLVESGIHLLVVAPGESEAVADAIVRVRRCGIPVVFFDRKADTDEYTAFIGGDNEAVGRDVGNYIVGHLKQRQGEGGGRKLRVLEITGAMNSSPAQDRHRGFSNVMAICPDVYYRYVESDWTGKGGYETVLAEKDNDWDVVFCHNDGMADGACQAYLDMGTAEPAKVIGVDGMPGKNQGIDYVEKGRFHATYIYPTHGEEIVKLALQILTGEPYERENVLQGMLVTPDNVTMTALTSNELMSQVNNLVTIHDKLEESLGLYNTQHKALLVSLLSLAVLIVALLLITRALLQMRRTLRERQAMHEEETLFYTNPDSRRLKQVFEMREGDLPAVRSQDAIFAETLNKAIRQNMSNPGLKMDELGEKMGISRVQLYRKVKALTGLTPVELLRQMRLQQAYVLLSTTCKTVNEIAYEVGFGTPGYFSQCFKHQYGKYPTELRELTK